MTNGRNVPVIDADGHVVEPPEMLTDYIEPGFRERIPRYERDGNREYWIPRDPTISRTPGWFPQEKAFVTCAPNNAGRPWSDAGRPYREGLAGAWDPEARIRDMDSDSPSELFRRGGYISFDADEKLLGVTAAHLGAERIIWASDYPHPDAKMPGVVKELEDNLESLSERDRNTILGGSSARLYGLPIT